MTVFVCSQCNRAFLYPATITASISGLYDGVVETRNCPYCKSDTFTEQTEPEQQQPIIALISVPNGEVNAKLAEGYMVMEDKIYAKDTIMVKRAGPKGDYVDDVAKVAQEAKS
jgi:hypothetical protein